jgi:hypothetical protein
MRWLDWQAAIVAAAGTAGSTLAQYDLRGSSVFVAMHPLTSRRCIRQARNRVRCHRLYWRLFVERRLLSIWIDRRRTEGVYWTLNSALWDLLAPGESCSVDKWLGNGWISLPVAAYKRYAFIAAQDLSWERESEKMVGHYNAVLAAAG